MSVSRKWRAAFAMVLVLLVAGCGPAATATPVPPPNMPIAPTPTHMPPTPTPLPPTATPLPPTLTPLPLTATPLPPTATPLPPTQTPAPPSSTPLPPTSRGLIAFSSDIGAFLDGLAANDQFSGAALIALDGKPIWQGAYGLADRTRGIPNQIDTRFNLGSMDKMFTAVAIMQLVEQGRLSVDDKIADVLPDYPNRQVAETVTIHQLLTHTSGMGDWSESERFPDLHDQIRRVEDYLPLFVDTPLEFEPGDRFRYSNSGYIVLGLIIERITGQSYYDYVRASIFEPSGMTGTGAYELDADVPNLARGYTRFAIDGSELDEITDYEFAAPMKGGPSGGGFSTVEDLLAFRNALLDGRLLSPASTGLLLAGKVWMDERRQYAYGFMDRMVENQRVVGHSGGAPGICDFMDIYLDLGYTVIVLSNTDTGCVAVRQYLLENPLR
jgi:D-alanyl-D-alanine carboxypeptidase